MFLSAAPRGNIEILGKQSELFPEGPVIKCLLSELLKICQKLQYREKSSSKQIKNKHSALSLYGLISLRCLT